MKTNLTYLLLVTSFLFYTSFSFCQTPAIEWQKSYGGTAFEVATCIKQTPEGGYIIAGSSSSSDGNVTENNGGWDYWIVKIDSAGTMEWEKSFGGSSDDYTSSIDLTPDGGYIVTGYTNSTDGDITINHGSNDYWVIKLDSLGTLEWEKTLGGSSDDQATSIQTTTDQGYIIAGQSNSNDGDVTGNHGGYDYWIVKLNATGNVVWQKSLGGTLIDVAAAIKQTPDGGYIIAGTSGSDDGDVTGNHGNADWELLRDYWVVKLGATGILEWEKCYGGIWNQWATCIDLTSDGGYIIAGYYTNDSPNYNDIDVTGSHSISEEYWVVKLNSTGAIVWQKCLGGYQEEIATAIQQTTDGGYLVAGHTNSSGEYNVDGDVIENHSWLMYDYWVVKLDPSGTIIWKKCFGGPFAEMLYSLQETTDGGVILAGMTTSIDGDITVNHGENDCWIVKLKDCPSSSTQTISVVECHNYVTPSGRVLTHSGIYSDVVLNSAGCDSTTIINLTITSPLKTTYVTACLSYTTSGGTVYTTPGWIYDTIPNTSGSGCDTIYRIYLTFEATRYLGITTCGSYTTPSGIILTTPGWFYDTIPDANGPGCDSIYRIDLTLIAPPGIQTYSTYACYSYISPSGKIWTQSGSYYDTLPSLNSSVNAPGCERIFHINLTVYNMNLTIASFWDHLKCQSGIGGCTYKWIDCENNNAIIPGANSMNFYPTEPGTYAGIASKNGCTDTTECFYFNTTDLDKLQLESLKIYPNPTQTKQFTVEFDGKISSIELTDLSGRIMSILVNLENGTVDCPNLVSGNFFVRVTTERGVVVEKIIFI